MEPFSNHFIEKELAAKDIVVDRWLNVTNTLLHAPKEIKKSQAIYQLCHGATSMATIAGL